MNILLKIVACCIAYLLIGVIISATVTRFAETEKNEDTSFGSNASIAMMVMWPLILVIAPIALAIVLTSYIFNFIAFAGKKSPSSDKTMSEDTEETITVKANTTDDKQLTQQEKHMDTPSDINKFEYIEID